jgi:tetratricopeptide (TPR) repeat protein
MNRPNPFVLSSLAVVVLLCVAPAAPCLAQATLWDVYIKDGDQAMHQGQYAKALKLYTLALEEAEKFGPTDPRLATSLNNLARLYYTQGDHAKAELLYKRSLAIREKALGPDHPHVATSLENYAKLLRATKRQAEAEKLEERAAAIRKAKQ